MQTSTQAQLMSHQKASDQIRIYVACLAAYNNGQLHGEWIDATQELEDIQDQINQMLSRSPQQNSEEYAIHDYEGFAGYGVGEYEGIQSVHEMACFIERHPEIGGELLNNFGGSLEDARKAADENYIGCYESLIDYAEELTTDTTEIPDNLRYYIDYEKIAYDMERSGDVYTIEVTYGQVHVFNSH